jgi:hypothetical protein
MGMMQQGAMTAMGKKKKTDRLMWAGIAGLSGMVTGVGSGAVAKGVWRIFRGKKEPDDPVSPRTPWADAILWSSLTATLTAIAAVSAERGLATLWRKLTGRYPRL